MAKYYDISAKITNELPTLKISDDLIVSINNRKNTILNVQAMVKEAERKGKESGEEDEFVTMEKSLEMMIGKENTKKINEMDLPITEYKEVFQAIMALAQGIDPEELDKTTPKQ